MPNIKYRMLIFRKQLFYIFYLKDQSIVIRIVASLSFFPRSDTSHFDSVKVTYSLTT